MKRWREFNYTGQWDGGAGLTYRPFITVMLSNGSKSISVIALIDSGCDCMMISSDIAETLGISSHPLRKIKVEGITGARGDGFKCEVTAELPSSDKFTADATFVPGLPFACLLGQRGFFDSFNVRFEKGKQKFYLQPIS